VAPLALPATVELVEVSPRDGLQTGDVVATATKVELIRRAVAAGLRRVEVASFAHPTRVPQMADAETVLAAVADVPDLVRTTLVLNQRGLDRALAAGVDEVNVVVLATEAFSQRNQGVSVEEAVAAWLAIGRRAEEAGLRAGVTISAAFGCPYEGEVDPRRVLELAERLQEAGPAEISLADTIGCAVPTQVGDLVAAVLDRTGTPVRCHLHDTRNTAVANVVAALSAGATALDASIGGLGGCPFAPRATGNVATEDLVYALERMGVATGVDLDATVGVAAWLEASLGRPVGGSVARAGGFPTLS
jgi:hydroxymethylglutaryl-CoA lyase